jgi:hypothetical protein
LPLLVVPCVAEQHPAYIPEDSADSCQSIPQNSIDPECLSYKDDRWWDLLLGFTGEDVRAYTACN